MGPGFFGTYCSRWSTTIDGCNPDYATDLTHFGFDKVVWQILKQICPGQFSQTEIEEKRLLSWSEFLKHSQLTIVT